MTLSSALQCAAKASLVLVFFAFPMSVALANIGLFLTLVFWLLGCVWGTSLRDTRQALSNPVALPVVSQRLRRVFNCAIPGARAAPAITPTSSSRNVFKVRMTAGGSDSWRHCAIASHNAALASSPVV